MRHGYQNTLCYLMIPGLLLIFTTRTLGFGNPGLKTSLVCNNIHKSAFKDIKKLATPLSVAQAVLTIGEPKHECSGAFISDAGHILTASHCLEECLFNPQSDGILTNLSSNVFCNVNINGRRQRIQVLLASKCAFALARAATAGMEQFKAKCADQSDAAIVIPTETPQNISCLSLGNPSNTNNEELFAIGMPKKTSRRDGHDADGESFVISNGQIIDSQTKHCTIVSNGYPFDYVFNKLQPGQRVEYKAKEVTPSIWDLRTTVDISPGSSGGPLINSRGEVLGVASYTIFPSDNFGERERSFIQCKGSSVFSRLPTADKLSSHFTAPGFSFQDIKCESKRASPSGIPEFLGNI